MIKRISSICLWAALSVACNNSSENKGETNKERYVTNYGLADKNDFETVLDGKNVDLFILKNKGIEAAITNYGGRLVNLLVPNKEGKLTDVIVGPGTLQQFVQSKEPYFGATIGRYGNRIAKGLFKLSGNTYHIPTNNGSNTLHGGINGFQSVVWDVRQPSDSVLVLSYLSKDGEEGFPGNLKVVVTYTLQGDTAMRIDYNATTDKQTVCNLTNHGFYNLNGYGSGSIDNHVLQINADAYIPVDSTLIPLGDVARVNGTPFDFTRPAIIGARINDAADIQLKNGAGYDHNYILNKSSEKGMQKAASVKGDLSGITMSIYTKEPGLQFYSGNFMQSLNNVKGDQKDAYRTAIALEPQHFPDSPNHSKYPSTELKPGQEYSTSSLYKFSIE